MTLTRIGILAFALVVASTPAFAQTSLTLQSQAGDSIGQGQIYFVTPSNGTFTTDVGNGLTEVDFAGFGATPSWELVFGGPQGALLTSGVYERADTAFVGNPTRPALEVDGDFGFCQVVTGRFTVLQVTYVSGNLQSLALDFEQHCDGAVAALFGSIRINSSIPVASRISADRPSIFEGDSGTRDLTFTVSLSRPSASSVSVHYATANGTASAGSDFMSTSGDLTFAPGVTALPVPIALLPDTLVEPNETVLLNLSLSSGATIDFGQGQGTIVNDDSTRTSAYVNGQTGDYVSDGGERFFTSLDTNMQALRASNGVSIRVDAGPQAGFWFFTFTAPQSAILTPGVYDGATRGPSISAAPGLDVSGEGRGCNTLTGRFVVFEAVYAAGGVVQSFAADFEQHCEGQGPALFGSVRYQYKAGSTAFSSVSVSDAAMNEGTADPRSAVFGVALSAPRQAISQISYATANGTAVQPGDYSSTTGTLTFERDATMRRISVPVVNETTPELDETFSVSLAAPSGLIVDDGQGIGTIVNDDVDVPAASTGLATSVGPDSVTMNGTVNPNGLQTTVLYEYGVDTGYGSESAATVVGPGITAVSVPTPVSGLLCATLYHFRIAATNDEGSTEGLDQTFTTTGCVPPTVTTLAATSITQTGATLNGTVNPNGVATVGRFDFGTTPGYGDNTPDLAIGAGNSGVPLSYTLTGRACGTPFHYRVVGENGGGIANGLDQTFTTAPCPAAGMGNISPASARAIPVNAASQDVLSTVRTEVWYKADLFANRSYQISAWTVGEDGAPGVNPISVDLFSDVTGTTLATPAPLTTSGNLEGSPNGVAALGQSVMFLPTTSGQYRIRVLGAPAIADTSINLMVRETTLFSPWFFVTTTSQYDAALEIHNNTEQPLAVTLKGFDPTGSQLGITHIFTLPANATVFKSVKTDLGVSGNGFFGGTVLTHRGAFGAISANTTTLSPLTGLSFDSPFTTRSPAVLSLPVR